MKTKLLFFIMVVLPYVLYGQPAFKYIVQGSIASTSGEPLTGASIRIKGSENMVLSRSKGIFTFHTNVDILSIRITHLGYKTQEIALKLPLEGPLSITMQDDPQQLEEVMISTGYESIAPERSTGSFEQLNGKLFNRATGIDILSRLEGVSTGTFFDDRIHDFNGRNPAQLSIRGLSTIRAKSAPLIILDNFPYEGDPALINPNDVLSVTLLKDAAAASIWGARAGNGVIVITTKRADYGQPFKITFNSAFSTAQKPNLMADRPISSRDFIAMERELFQQGFFNSQINGSARQALTPVIELLWQVQNGSLDSLEAEQLIHSWQQIDVRDDFLKYVYRRPFQQQYAINAVGGSTIHTYTLSAGFDRNLDALNSNGLNRFTLRSNNHLKITNNLEISMGMLYTMQRADNALPSAGIGYGQLNIRGKNLYPYARLADGRGTPLPIAKDLRQTYVDTVGRGSLLDWNYFPLNELDNAQQGRQQDMRLNLDIDYKLNEVLRAEVQFMQQLTTEENRALYPADSYYARNLVNLYSQEKNGSILHPIPVGGILNLANRRAQSYALRGQLKFNHQWATKHLLSALAGAEIRQMRTQFRQHMPVYGYDDLNLTNIPAIDYAGIYEMYDGLRVNGYIPGNDAFSGTINRFVSVYANTSYTFLQRYTAYVSARRDASNVFGVKQNQKWTPLWSAGIGWQVSDERFYNLTALPRLKLRMSYGYSGNIDPSVSAQTILYHVAGNLNTGLPYASASTPPNPNLRWEKVRTINWGLDFESSQNRLSGSVEYYWKDTQDLFADARIDPTLGFGTSAVKNSANTSGRGIDLTLHTRNLVNSFLWSSHFLLSYNKVVIKRYMLSSSNASNYVSTGLSINPVENSVAYPIYSYRWAGLDANTGDPMGYLSNEVSRDYAAILNDTPIDDLVLHGSARPLYYGSLRNDFDYKNVSLSVNLTWSFDYYFRKPALGYYDLFNNWKGNEEYSRRWQHPGDELQTNVPSFSYPADSYRDDFYRGAEINVLKGDHIRLQDVRLAYHFKNIRVGSRVIDNIQLYAYANNLAILWRANNEGLDPKYMGEIGASRTFSIGITTNL